MIDQSKPDTDDEIWDKLLLSEASLKYLDEQIRKAQELLKIQVI